MNSLKMALIAVALIWPSLLMPLASNSQDSAQQARYNQAMQAAQAQDYERAYELAVKAVAADMLFYEANVLRIALATILKKTGPEDPKNLIITLKRQAPIGSKPEHDAQELVNRLMGAPTVEARAPVAVSPYVRQKLALVVGVGAFTDPKISPLKYVSNDARVFADTLRAQCGFDYVETLVNEDATTYNIKTKMNQLAGMARPDDLVVVYFAGHGSPENLDNGGINYIITYNTEVDNLYATAYGMNDLLNDIERRISAERVVAFIDTCYSGATFKEKPKVWVTSSRDLNLALGPRDDLLKERLLRAERNVKIKDAAPGEKRQKQGTGRVIIASSRQDQQSWEGKSIQHGYFTYFLIEAVKRRETVSVQGLYNYLREEVPKAVQRDLNKQQHPTMVASVNGPVEIYLKDRIK